MLRCNHPENVILSIPHVSPCIVVKLPVSLAPLELRKLCLHGNEYSGNIYKYWQPLFKAQQQVVTYTPTQ